MSNPVFSPSHYTDGDIECIDAIEASMSQLEYIGYLKGNVEKYIWRFRYKNGSEDLLKARCYLEVLIDRYDKWEKIDHDKR